MHKSFRVNGVVELLVCLVVGALFSVAQTYQYISWELIDARYVINTLRESAPALAILSGLLVVYFTRANNPKVLAVGPVPARSYSTIVMHQILAPVLSFLVGLMGGAVPALVAARDSFEWVYLLPLLAVAIGVVAIWTLAALVATVVTHPVRWFVVPVLTVALVGLVEIINTDVISTFNRSDTRWSLLSFSLFWDIPFPEPGLTYSLPVEGFRALLFIVECCVFLICAQSWRNGASWGARLTSLSWLASLLPFAIGATLVSPELVVPSSESSRCTTTSEGIEVCLYPSNERLRDDVVRAIPKKLTRLKSPTGQWTFTDSREDRYSPGHLSIFIPNPGQGINDGYVVDNAVSRLAYSGCGRERTESTRISYVVGDRLSVFFGQRDESNYEYDDIERAAYERLKQADDDQFIQWWNANSAKITRCSLRLSDLP